MEKIKIGKKTYFLLTVLSAFLLGAPASGFGETSKANANDSLKSEAKKIELKAEEDFDKALEAAKKEGKILMLEFTGSDWCPPCKMLHKFVLNTEEFTKYAQDKLKVVVADFTRLGEPKNKAHAKKYRELAEKYNLRGFPTIIFIDPKSGENEMMVGLEVRTPAELKEKAESFKERMRY